MKRRPKKHTNSKLPPKQQASKPQPKSDPTHFDEGPMQPNQPPLIEPYYFDPYSPTFLLDTLIEGIPEHERKIAALQLKMAGQATVDPKLIDELENEIGLLDMCQQAKEYRENPDGLAAECSK